MSNEIQVFNFEQSNVRTFIDENGNLWFCASDVCKVLGYASPRDAIAKHTVKKGVAKRDTPTSSGTQELKYIDERNLYRLVMRSKLPAAERFQDWICGEVIPTIRKTGSYGKPVVSLPDFTNPAIAARAWAEQYEKSVQLENKVKKDAPKVDFFDNFVTATGLLLVREVANALKLSEKDTYAYLNFKKVVYRLNGRWKASKWALDQGLVVEKFNTGTAKDGHTYSSVQLYITPKGAHWTHRKMKENLMPVPVQLELPLQIGEAA